MSSFIQKTLNTTALTPTYIQQHTQHNTTQHNTTHHTPHYTQYNTVRTPHHHTTRCCAPATFCDMSETQHHCLQQDQANFIQKLHEFWKGILERIAYCDSRNREHAKTHALWPLLLCVAVALRRRLVLVVWLFFFLYVWWCGVVLRVLVVVVFVALCCVHGFVCVICVVFLALVFMEFLMAQWVRQWFCWALPSSWVTRVQHFHFWRLTCVRLFHVRGGFCSRIVLGRAGAWVSCSLCARVHRTKTSNNTYHSLQTTCYTPIAAHKKITDIPIATQPLSR